MEALKYDETIDIYATPKIKINRVKSKTERKNIINIQGENIDYSIVNTLRRAIDLYVPVYFFRRENIKIDSERSNSIYNNDMIYNVLETMPIYDVDNEFNLSDMNFFVKSESERNIGVDDNVSREKMDEIKITLSVDNNSDNYYYVTTHDLKLTINGKIKKNYKNHDPLTLIVLGPRQKIFLQAIASINIGFLSHGFSAVCLPFYRKIKENEFELTVKTLDQLSFKRIVEKACDAVIFKLNNINNNVSEIAVPSDIPNVIDVNINGEEHTIGNLIGTVLQKCRMTKSAGYNVPHDLIDQVIIKYEVEKKIKDPLKILIDSNNYLVKIFKEIKNIVMKLPDN